MTTSTTVTYGLTADQFLSLLAANRADLSRTTVLLDANPDLVNAVTSKDVTPLMLAVMGGHADIAGLLLDRGANINARDFEGSTALLWAVADRNEDIARLLLSRGADWTLSDASDKSPYDQARNADCEGIASAIEASMAAGPPNSRTAVPRRGALDIAVAAAKGKAGELRQIVVDYPDSPRWHEPVTGATALRNVVVYHVLGVEDARFLLEKGADVNARDNGGWTVLIHAVNGRESSPFTDIFIAAGADPSLKNEDGETAADIAKKNNNTDCVKIERCALEQSIRGTQASMKVGRPLMLKR